MDESHADFVARYAAMDERRLMAVARDYDALTEDAKPALRAEFARRSLEPPLIEETTQATVLENSLVIASYRDMSEALVARSLLEDAGVEVFLQNENLASIHWGLSNAIGGVRLQVKAADADVAVRLLRETAPEDIVFDEDEEPYLQPTCPVCGSENISFQGADRDLALLAVFVLKVPLPVGRKSWLCNACGARWEDTEDNEDDEAGEED